MEKMIVTTPRCFAQHGRVTYPSIVAVPPPSSLITKMQFSSNTVPVLKLMVVVMAFCAVGASIRRSHLVRCIRCRAEKWVVDIRVYFCIFCVVVVCTLAGWHSALAVL